MAMFDTPPRNRDGRLRLCLPIGLAKSLRVAFKNLFRRNMTIQYPHQRAHIPERARFAVEVIYGDDGATRCTACKICEGACPDFCLDLDVETREDKTKHIRHFRYDRGACMMCGLCVEACPFGALRMGHDYELAHTGTAQLRQDLIVDEPAYVRPKPTPKPVGTPSESKAGLPSADSQSVGTPSESKARLASETDSNPTSGRKAVPTDNNINSDKGDADA